MRESMIGQQSVLVDAGFKLSYADQTTLHPLGLATLLACGAAMFLLPRRFAVWPVIAITCFVAPAQRLVILGFDFNLLRMIVILGWLGILARNQRIKYRWVLLDTLVLAWALVQTVTYSLLMGSQEALVNRLGLSFEAVGLYLLFRTLIHSWKDIDSTMAGFMWIVFPVAALFLVEHATGRNVFAFFGGVSEYTAVREGRLRCQGAFPHSILAGCFWASVMPWIVARWWTVRGSRTLVIGASAACLLIVICTASSTPIMGVAAGVIGGAAFLIRSHLRLVRWCAVLALCVCHMVMNGPVWHLVARVSAVGGSTGWHRYKVIDEAIRHFDEWWFLGTASVSHWNIWAGDITNQYVTEGVTGGVAKLGIFVMILTVAFGIISRACAGHNKAAPKLALSWALGVSLFTHCMSFIGVTYFGQTHMVWYLNLAMIGSLSSMRVRVRPRTVRSRIPRRWQTPQVCMGGQQA